MTPAEVVRILGVLRASYAALESTEERLALWSLLLADQDAAAIGAAAVAYLRAAHPFPPSPGELIAAARVPDGAPLPEEAWGEVRRAIQSVGPHQEPEWSHPRVGAAVRAALGEWSVWCRSVLTEQLVADRARYVDAYRAIGDRDRARDSYAEACALIERGGGIAALLGGSDIGRIG